jgi:hypothetical protein
MSALAAFPRAANANRSIVFFGGIASLTRDAYFERLHTITREDYARDISDQCHFVASIVAFKFCWIRRAMLTLLIAAVPGWLASRWRVGCACTETKGIVTRLRQALPTNIRLGAGDT